MAEIKSYRRTRYIVRKGFQLKYVGILVGIALLGAAIAGYTIYYNSWVLLGDKLANVYPQGRLMYIFKTVNIRLAISLFFVSLLCVGIGIFASHKIAGPVYRMIGFLDSVSRGDYRQRLKLRKGDELTDLAEAINRMVDAFENIKKS